MTPKLIFAVLGILAAIGSLVFTLPHLLVVAIILIGIAVVFPRP